MPPRIRLPSLRTWLRRFFYNMTISELDSLMEGGGFPTATGLPVSEAGALRHITVYSCVRVRAETFGSFPLKVYRRRPDGKGRDEAFDHPVYGLLHSAPNEEMTSMSWREAMNGHLDLSGNCYSIITKNQRGQVVDVYPWDWRLIEPKRNLETMKLEYHLNDRGKTEILPPDRVFHVPGFSYNGLRGYSIIRLAAEAVAIGLSISEFTARFFGQGMNVGSVLETDKTFKSRDEIEELKKEFGKKYSGLAHSHEPLILTNGLKFSRIPMPLNDAQFIETTKLNMDQLCGLYRVPPHLIANLDRATFNNIEHMSLEFVMYSMLPLVTRFEQTINWKLFTSAERAAGYYAKFNMDGLLRGDAKSRAEALNIRRQNGTLNADEWRALEDENPIGGLAGEAYLCNGNMITVETAARQQPKQTGGGGNA